MINGRNIRAAAFAAVIAAWSAPAGAEMQLFSAVEFRGLRLLAKEDILRRSPAEARGNMIAIDPESVERALKSFALVKDYSIQKDRKGGRLVITVAERDPLVIVAIQGNKQTVAFELDSGLDVIAFNRVHSDSLPLVYARAGAMEGRKPGREFKEFCALLLRVKKAYSGLYREIKEIYYGSDYVEVILRGRRTRFHVRPDMENFRRLTFIAGYLDTGRRYPERITITDDRVLIRQGV